MLQKIRNNMFYIITPIYLTLLFLLHPVLVPRHFSEVTYLIGTLVVLLAVSLIIRSILSALENQQK